MTKIFCDIADINQIRDCNKKKIVMGFTTNPTLMRKAGAKDYLSYSKKILSISNKKPVSLEVFADDPKNIKKQAFILNNLGKNVFVKIPIINSKGLFLGKVIKELNKAKIKLNITAVYSDLQTKKILNCIDNDTQVIISIFAGRMADVGKDPIPVFKNSIKLSKKFKSVKILWASTREPYNFIQARQLGCHLITVPPAIINQIENFGSSFNRLTYDTVKTFLNDAKKSKFKI